MAITKYNEKRNFDVTPEPEGKVSPKNKFRFVVQRHQASRLHYDLRLELDGVLKSWAVPKGPSLNPADKRLAMMVEDHPTDYINFAGTIPEGNYGAGTVEIWDSGTYTPVNEKHEIISHELAIAALKNGQLKFAAKGGRLNGEFVLIQLKRDPKGNSWLLIKHRDEFAVDNYDSEDFPPQAKASPVKSAKIASPEEKKQAPGKGSSSVKKRPPVKKKPDQAITSLTSTGDAYPESIKKFTDFYKPMLATLTDKPFDDINWVYELKWDGYRAIAEWNKKELKLYSRNGLSFVKKYPVVADAIKKIKRSVVLDGEIVIFNEDGEPDFQKLQQYEDNPHLPLLFYVFDLLFLDGKNICGLPLVKRKALLKELLADDPVIKYCDHIEEHGIQFFKEVSEINLEGIIAKRADSTYTCAVRTREWLKIKHVLSREAIITGFTAPRGGRKHFGALILAQYDNKELKYMGHTGTGFDEKSLKSMWQKMQPLIVDRSPFNTRIKVNSPVTWLKPELICQINYTEETEGGLLRHPVFLGLRTDKNLHEVQKSNETPQKAGTPETIDVHDDDGDKVVVIDRHKVSLTNLNKIFWPEEKYTKGDLVNYYQDIATFILPYLKNRPLSLKRNPNGIADDGFYHKDAGEAAPSWVKKAEMYSESTDKMIQYIMANDAASLAYIANLGCIEINPWNSTTKKPDNPDYLVIDLDPSDKNTFDHVIETALAVKKVLDKAGAVSYCKTSGASGLHIYIPMGNKYSYDQVKGFGEIIAMSVQETLPEITSIERSLKKRGDKIYIDFLQNRKGQTLASVYSVRPKPGATVSTPLEWSEVKPGLHPSQFTIRNIFDRLKQKGDLFSGVLQKGIDLHKCLKKL